MGFQFRLDLIPPPREREERLDPEEPVLWLEPVAESDPRAGDEAAFDPEEPINADMPLVVETGEGEDGWFRLYPTSMPDVYLSHPHDRQLD